MTHLELEQLLNKNGSDEVYVLYSDVAPLFPSERPSQSHPGNAPDWDAIKDWSKVSGWSSSKIVSKGNIDYFLFTKVPFCKVDYRMTHLELEQLLNKNGSDEVYVLYSDVAPLFPSERPSQSHPGNAPDWDAINDWSKVSGWSSSKIVSKENIDYFLFTKVP